MPAPDHERQPMSSTQPSAKQLTYLRALAKRTGQTFTTPRTSQDASVEIRRLKATPPESRVERTIERNEIAAAITGGRHDSTRVTQNEVTGYGINCRWSH
jgi:hypothetical protein